MTAGSAHSATPADSSHAGLLIVTGASHTGKSSVIRSLLPRLEPPVALLGVDDVIAQTLTRPTGDRWEEIPLAYDLIQRQIDPLLDRGWLIVVETTFTYVPLEGEASFHREALDAMIGLAERRGAPWFLFQVKAPLELALRRSEQDGRLPAQVIAATVELHESAALPESTVELLSEGGSPDALAESLVARLPPPLRGR